MDILTLKLYFVKFTGLAPGYFTGDNLNMLSERILKILRREQAGESAKEVKFKSGAVLRLAENKGEFSLELKKGDENINLLDFAPPGTQLVKYEKSRKRHWGATLDYRGTGRAVILFDGLENTGDLLSFLHEAGHLHDAHLIRAVNAAKYAHMGAADYHEEDYSPKRMLAMAKQWRAVRDSEYAAWEHALKDANNLDEKYGLKIFEELGGAEGVQKIIRSCVETYEARYVRWLSEANIEDVNEMERYFTGLLKGEKADNANSKEEKN